MKINNHMLTDRNPLLNIKKSKNLIINVDGTIFVDDTQITVDPKIALLLSIILSASNKGNPDKKIDALLAMERGHKYDDPLHIRTELRRQNGELQKGAE